jgi:anaerobic dimethyl sulfoxide reductase subunit C (anchor subunit)
MLFFLTTGWLLILQFRNPDGWKIKTYIGWIAILLGTGNVFCMAHIYLMPTQLAWDSWLTILSFFSTALLLGVTALTSILLMDLRYTELRKQEDIQRRRAIVHDALGWFSLSAGVFGLLVIIENFGQIQMLNQNPMDTAQMSLQLLMRLYPALFVMRLASLILGVGGLSLAVAWWTRHEKPVTDLLAPSYVTFLLVIVGEILGRFLFYATHVRLGL